SQDKGFKIERSGFQHPHELKSVKRRSREIQGFRLKQIFVYAMQRFKGWNGGVLFEKILQFVEYLVKMIKIFGLKRMLALLLGAKQGSDGDQRFQKSPGAVGMICKAMAEDLLAQTSFFRFFQEAFRSHIYAIFGAYAFSNRFRSGVDDQVDGRMVE